MVGCLGMVPDCCTSLELSLQIQGRNCEALSVARHCVETSVHAALAPSESTRHKQAALPIMTRSGRRVLWRQAAQRICSTASSGSMPLGSECMATLWNS